MSPRALATDPAGADDDGLESWRALARPGSSVLRLVPTEPEAPARDDDEVRVALLAQVHQAKVMLIGLSDRLTELLALAEQEERAVWESSMDPQRLALQRSLDVWMADRRRQLDDELQAARTAAAHRRYAAAQVRESNLGAGFVRSSFG